MKSISVVFLDRDGVLNKQAAPHQYITRWEDFEYLPNAYKSIRLLNRKGFRVFIVSNQRCVARGMATIEEVEALNAKIKADLNKHGCQIDEIYYCPHDETAHCRCRKPRTGMLESAQGWLRLRGETIDKRSSWMIGDFNSDVQTGINFGINTVHVRSTGVDTSDPVPMVEDRRIHIDADGIWNAVNLVIQFNGGVEASA